MENFNVSEDGSYIQCLKCGSEAHLYTDEEVTSKCYTSAFDWDTNTFTAWDYKSVWAEVVSEYVECDGCEYKEAVVISWD